MDLNNNQNDRVLPNELLEDCWFFRNLLHTNSNSNSNSNSKSKSRMLRSFSDPCSSSNVFPGKSYEETYDSLHKTTPTNSVPKQSRSNRKLSSKKDGLVRAPSLPTSLESSQDFHDEEIEFSMGKLIRQASLNYSDTRPPRRSASKSFTAGSSLTQQQSRRKPPSDEEEIRPPRRNQLKTQKSLKDLDLEIEELQGFKDLGLIDSLEEKDLSAKSNSNSQLEKKRVESYWHEEQRPYMSAPPVPRWGGKRSTDDMKAQIKFWARAVATNVRQEC